MRAFLFTLFPPDDQSLADMLYCSSPEFSANAGEDGFSEAAVIAIDADLDQLVSLQCMIDFLEYGGGQSIAGNTDHGMKVVGLSAKCAALRGRKFNHFATH